MEAEKFVEDYETALASQNWALVAPLIAEGATVTFSSGHTYNGKTQIEKAFVKNFSTIKNEKYTIENLNWLMQDNSIGVYTFDFKWEGIIKDVLANGSGRGTSVIINKEGNWQLLTEHLGPMPKNELNQAKTCP